MKVAIVKYNGGNTQSVVFALERMGISAVVTNDKEAIGNADKVIFPGVGEASSAMKYLKENGLDKLIADLSQPVLGICLGMQLLCSHSEEGNTSGLGVFDIKVKRFAGEKVPHMGWNTVNGASSLLEGIPVADPHFYFVHSYYAEECRYTTAVTEYGQRFSSILQKDNFYGVQFHPEKSAEAGELVIKNFIAL
jgi:imidazole glycerol-phosphate synthase subunit HisH